MGAILVVDDDRVHLELIKEFLLLKDDEFLVFLARNGKKGLEMSINISVDFGLIITDINMLEMKGDEMVREIRKINPHIPVIFMSGDKSNFRGLADLGNVDFIGKPIQLGELRQKIQKLLAK